MKLFKITLVALCVLAFAAACGGGEQTNQTANNNARAAATPAPSTPTPTPDELADARATYKNTCTRCHKEDGSGGPFELEDGEVLKVPTLREGHALKDSDADFVKKIQNGGDGMPRFKDKLTGEQINALVRLIRRDFQGKTSAGASASPSPAR